MCAEMIPLSHMAVAGDGDVVVALDQGLIVNRRHFVADVATFAATLPDDSQRAYALYYESAYPFAVMLYAVWHAGHEVWVPGNNRPATGKSLMVQGCRLLGDWSGQEDRIEPVASCADDCLNPLNPSRTRLTIFTSGSSGEPKAVVKTLTQLQREVDVFERQWGSILDRAGALATVSHQHLYGLSFRLLWPLSAQRGFFSPTYLSPEPLLKAANDGPAYWVASPAQLRRLDELSDWDKIAGLKAIFSSGGPLPIEAAQQIEGHGGPPVIEIYGSSETGAIGWRRPPQESAWLPLIDMRITQEGDRCRLYSPLLGESQSTFLDDAVECREDGRFSLLGRLDRIVKVEEKRLSLNEMEQAIGRFDQITSCHCLLLTGGREQIAAAAVIADDAWPAWEGRERKSIIMALRMHLLQYFEPVALPKKWLFVNELPLTPQAKIDSALLRELFKLDSEKFPQILFCRREDNQVELTLRIRGKLVYFSGHFPETPILPGVAQLAWVERYGKLFFAIAEPFVTMEVVKFKKIIRPEAVVTMRLEWKATSGKLYFEVNSVADAHSSGRMVYGAVA